LEPDALVVGAVARLCCFQVAGDTGAVGLGEDRLQELEAEPVALSVGVNAEDLQVPDRLGREDGVDAGTKPG
jgi:predicted nucleic acid-binding protein